MPSYSITTPTADLPFEMKQTENGGSVFVKNSVIAYQLTSSGFNEITDIDYPSHHTYAVSSITRSGTTATVTTTATNSLLTGQQVTIAGANETDYNGTFAITVTVAGSQFTYTVANSPSTPATGTITAVGGKDTVPGIVYLDTYIFVQDTDGNIQNSDVGDETAWDPLATIAPEMEPSLAVCIKKSLNALVAMKSWDTEFFVIDATIAPPASPLSRVESSYIKLGCATADSVVEFDGGIVFMSKRDNLQRSREIHVLNGLTPKKISTANVERILNNDDLATCYSLYLSTAGHQFYVLTLKTSAITLVYDFSNGYWYVWTILTAQSSQTPIALSQEEGIATCVITDHGFSDGDPVLVAGADQNGYNGAVNITYIDANTFSYPVDSSTVSPATGTITATGYDESYFPAVAYATYQNLDLILHETNGTIYALDPETTEDTDVPINFHLRLPQWNGGTPHNKVVNRGQVIGDIFDSSALIRYSEDDSATYSDYRPQDLSNYTTKLTRLGMTQMRVYEVRHTAATKLRLDQWQQEQTVSIE